MSWPDATAQADAVRRGDVSPLELVDAAIARIEAARPLNAVVADLFDRARAQAAGPLPDGPFTGVPLLLKDLGSPLAGVIETGGSVATRSYVAPATAPTVQRLLDAGMIPVGRTNTPEFGNHCATEPALFGPTANPWSSDRSPGGSSGGSAAAVAAGLTAVATGSDATGSIRVPAACCGLVGLKPSRGRVPTGTQVLDGLGVSGVLTRTVRDTEACLQILGRPLLGEPYGTALPSWTPPSGPLRIAVDTTAPFGGTVDDRVRAVVEVAATALAGLGHGVEPARPALDPDAALAVIATLHEVDNVANVAFAGEVLGRPPRDEELDPVTRAMALAGSRVTGAEHAAAIAGLHAIGRAASRVFADHDVFLCPTLTGPVPRPGELSAPRESTEAFFRVETAVTGWVALANLAGWAAITLPLGDADGLPVGVQLMAPTEAPLLLLAAQLETALPWADRHP